MGAELPVFHVLGRPYYMGGEAPLIAWLLRRRKTGRTLHVANVHTAMTAFWDAELMASQTRADLSLADGRPLSLAGKILGCWEAEQLRGPDLMLSAARAGRRSKHRHFFLGGAAGVAKQAAAALKRATPGLSVVGTHSPPFRALGESDIRSMVLRLKRSRTDICWVGLGAPKQEKLMERLRAAGAPCVFVGVGAGFDYFAGTKSEAPKWMQRASLEWVYRLGQEPGRLWWRYLSTNGPFLAAFASEYAGIFLSSKQGRWVRSARIASLAFAAFSVNRGDLWAALVAALAPLIWGRLAWLSGGQR